MARSRKRSRPRSRRRRAPARRRTSSRPAPRPRARSRSRKSGRRKNPDIHTAKGKAQVAAAGAIYGYARQHTGLGNPEDGSESIMAKVTMDKIGPLASHGILLHILARKTSGQVSSWSDAMSVACLGAAGINLGYTKGNVDEAAALEGYEYGGGALEGVIDIDEREAA